jgi:hypothetical protein
VSRSKRLNGVADATRRIGAACRRPGLTETGSSDPSARVLFFLALYILAYHGLVSTDPRDEIAARPKVRAREIALAFAVGSRQVNGALALDGTRSPATLHISAVSRSACARRPAACDLPKSGFPSASPNGGRILRALGEPDRTAPSSVVSE